MLTIPIEKLVYVITKAREYAEVPPVDEDSGSNHAERDVLEETPENPTRQELADAIDALGESERIELLALTCLGRGDYTKAEWRDAIEDARAIHDRKETSYLLGTPLLGDYIEEGLSQLGYLIGDYEMGRL